MATVRSEIPLPEITIRPMTETDVPSVVTLEREAYLFPWSEGIFRDCLRVGYLCRVIDLAGAVVGFGIMSAGAGEAHVLNICVRSDLRCRGLGARMLETFPMVPLTDYLGLCVAQMSYDGKLFWGFTADYDVVPDLAAVVRATQEAFDELRRVAGDSYSLGSSAKGRGEERAAPLQIVSKT